MTPTLQQWHFLFMVLITALMGSGVLLIDRAYLDRVPRIPQPVPSCTPLDLNRATFDELVGLPLVSPEMARSILATRREAPIDDPRELLMLPGFDPYRIARLAPYVVPFRRRSPKHRKPGRHAPSGL